jgi:hypothetical protein
MKYGLRLNWLRIWTGGDDDGSAGYIKTVHLVMDGRSNGAHWLLRKSVGSRLRTRHRGPQVESMCRTGPCLRRVMKWNGPLPHQGTVTLIRLTFTTHTGSWSRASHAQPQANNTWLYERYTAMVSMCTISFNCHEPSATSYISPKKLKLFPWGYRVVWVTFRSYLLSPSSG